MATTNECKELARRMLEVLDDADLSLDEAAEIAVNVYGFIMKECGASVHDAVGGVMEYYKENADH